MPRIIAGSARGIRLETLDGAATRPTADNRKEAIFSSIQFDLPGACFLDLFSGSGSCGLEALSRGAAEAVLVEVSREASEIIKKNIVKTHLKGASLMNMDVYQAIESLGRAGRKFDLIFLDPPYHQGHESKVLTLIAQQDLLAKDGCIVCECAVDDEIRIPESFRVRKRKDYRITQFLLIESVKEMGN